MFERNLGFLSSEEQLRIEDSVVSIAGAGGDGGLLAVQLARMGVGELRLADPDPFEIENTNRQAVCRKSTINTNKAVAVASYASEINPNMRISIFDSGINKENMEEFVRGSNLVIDETEFTLHSLAVMLAREARKWNVPNLTAFNIGFGAVSTTYHPRGQTLESRLGFSEDQDIKEITESKVPLSRWLPYLPPYGDIDVLSKVSTGEKPAPSLAPGVALASSVGVTQAFLNLVQGMGNHRPNPIYAPKAIVMDSMSIEAKVIKFNRLSHARHLAKVVLRNSFKINPKASY